MKEAQKYFVFIICLLFVILAFFLQVSPATNASYMERVLKLTHENSINISAIYFLPFVLLQIPNGIFFDKYGIKYLLPIGISIVILGNFVYWLSMGSITVALGRFITGIGASVAYISALYVALRSFKKQFFPLCVGLAEASCTLGAIISGNVYHYVLKNFGWDTANIIVIVFAFILLLISIVLLKNYKPSNTYSNKSQSWSQIIGQIKELFKSKILLFIFLYAFTSWLIIMSFAGYWAKSYFMHMHGYSAEKAMTLGEIYWASFLVSGVISGFYLKTLKRIKQHLYLVATLGVIFYSLMITPILFSYSTLIVFAIFAGISASGVITSFALTSYIVSDDLASTAAAINNTFVILGGVIGQISFGYVVTNTNFKNLPISENINVPFYIGLCFLYFFSIMALLFIAAALRSIKDK